MMLWLRAVAALLLLLAAPAFAQTWPAKQVRIVVPFPRKRAGAASSSRPM
jgi:tripartite-type tricarboxylate transporter receptor subunit TctC